MTRTRATTEFERERSCEAAVHRSFAARDHGARAPAPTKTTRTVVVGDPQTTAARFFAVLAHHDVLDDSGWLRRDVGLVSVGDHFDFRPPPGMSHVDVGEEGLAILSWLCAHDSSQVAVLLGNHDTSRVMELASFNDERFAAARAEAEPLEVRRKQGASDGLWVRDREAFLARWPELPSPELVDRDYATFSVRQRTRLIAWLLGRRVALATTVRLASGHEALVTHAGVTTRELSLLGIEARSCSASLVAARLNALLEERVALVGDAWARGEAVPLDLSPLHRTGTKGIEGGGLLYHRPTRPEVKNDDQALALRRRYHPRELPRGLVQVCGHVGHAKLLSELGDWVSHAARTQSPGALRTLVATDNDVGYSCFAPRAGAADEAVLHFVDGAMNSTVVQDVEILDVVPGSFDR